MPIKRYGHVENIVPPGKKTPRPWHTYRAARHNAARQHRASDLAARRAARAEREKRT